MKTLFKNNLVYFILLGLAGLRLLVGAMSPQYDSSNPVEIFLFLLGMIVWLPFLPVSDLIFLLNGGYSVPGHYFITVTITIGFVYLFKKLATYIKMSRKSTKNQKKN